MISFAPTAEQAAIADMVGKVARGPLRDVARGLDRQGLAHRTMGTLDETGLVALALDPDTPVDSITNWMAIEQLAGADAALAVALAAPLGYVRAVMRHGTGAQRDACRAAWDQGFRGGAVLVHEPRFGFDPTDLHTRAERKGDGFALNGIKGCVPLAAASRDFLVVAATGSGPRCFIVPSDAAGVTIAAAEGSLGLKSLDLTEVHFADVALPADALLGEGDGADPAPVVAAARTALTAILTGLSQAVLAHLIPYLKDRVAHGTALARKQSVAFRLADMAIEIPAMRWMGWRAAEALDSGDGAARAARQAQLYCAEQALWISDEGVQLMGGHGFMRENPVERWFRDVRTLATLEGMVGL